MFLALEEVVQHLLALGVADLLQDHLLRRLGADAPEIDRLQRHLDVVFEGHVADLGLRLGQADLLLGVLDGVVGHHQPAAEGLELARLAIDFDAHVGLFVHLLLGGRGQRQFERREHDVLGHVLFARQRIHQQQQFSAHRSISNASL